MSTTLAQHWSSVGSMSRVCWEAIDRFNPYPAKLIYLNFQPLEVVSRYRDPQTQVVENYQTFTNIDA